MTGRMARVLELLVRTRGFSGGICALDDFYRDALANGRNDISVLWRRGWDIEVWSERHDIEEPFHRHYRLVREGRRARPERVAKQQAFKFQARVSVPMTRAQVDRILGHA